jgi:uncharacterized protein Yka (UPF0111/DUF47 family)
VSFALREHPAAGLVVKMAANLERAASLLLEMMAGDDGARVYEIMERERVGDELTRDLLTYLESGSLVTDALARDDLRELAGVLEDALDAVAAAAEGVRLYRLDDPVAEMRELAQGVAHGTTLVRRAVASTESCGGIRRCWLELARLEHDGETLAATLRARMREEGTAVAGRWRDIVDLTEEALHGCQHAGAILVAAVLQPA